MDRRGKYVELLDHSGSLNVAVQSVSHPGRVHLDIETDDVAATAFMDTSNSWMIFATSGPLFQANFGDRPGVNALALSAGSMASV